MAKKSFFFIPDISGFTHFVKNVEVTHSRHIISELLEIIIDSNQLGLEMVEIEGDAIFFYKPDEVPDADEILHQVRRTFVKFHEHLKLYESHRVCQCGACSFAADLNIIDSGEVERISVKGESKPFGESVIRVHRLLKNEVKGDEYVLYTGGLMDGTTSSHLDVGWSLTLDGASMYEGFGPIDYRTIDLGFLKSEIQLPPSLPKGTQSNNPLAESFTIRAPKNEVFEMITNLDDRPKWSTGVDLFKYLKGQVNRVGTKHVCVIGNKTIGFETVKREAERGKLVYGERTTELPWFKEATTYFVVDGDDSATNVLVEFHYEVKPFFGYLFKGLFLRKLKEGLYKNMKLLTEELEGQRKPDLKEAV